MRILSRLVALVALAVAGVLLAVLIQSSVHGPTTTVTTTETKKLVRTVVQTTTRPVKVAVPPAQSADDAVVVLSPRGGEHVQSGFTVAGDADVFEGRLMIRLYDAQGTELVRNQVTASCGTGCRGLFASTLYYSVEKAQKGMLVVEDSAAGGKTPHQVKVPVTLDVTKR